mmetsp:Transcript_55463/g.154584  ORF Transcript_55463/g.154584 Transcript_55463/m.154584 type:complete len:337 (+) Transcript_55463:514-1524(+)
MRSPLTLLVRAQGIIASERTPWSWTLLPTDGRLAPMASQVASWTASVVDATVRRPSKASRNSCTLSSQLVSSGAQAPTCTAVGVAPAGAGLKLRQRRLSTKNECASSAPRGESPPPPPSRRGAACPRTHCNKKRLLPQMERVSTLEKSFRCAASSRNVSIIARRDAPSQESDAQSPRSLWTKVSPLSCNAELASCAARRRERRAAGGATMSTIAAATTLRAARGKKEEVRNETARCSGKTMGADCFSRVVFPAREDGAPHKAPEGAPPISARGSKPTASEMNAGRARWRSRNAHATKGASADAGATPSPSKLNNALRKGLGMSTESVGWHVSSGAL